ncbi:MAG: hypothetical protein MJZ11_04120 [Lachnospiraceae bacterium]|nr:hypothetical protein [Lachnospiraceae bacterium]
MKVLRIILIVTLTALCAVLGLFSYKLNEKVESYNEIAGDWSYIEDFKSIAARNAYDYLSDSGYKEVTIEDIEGMMSDVKIPVTLSIKTNGKKAGTYEVNILEDDYANASEKAYEVLSECIRDILVKRLMAAEIISKEANEEEQDRVIKESLGMELIDVIKEHGPELLPNYDEIENLKKDNGSFGDKDGFIVSVSDVTGKSYVITRIKDTVVMQGVDVENEEVYIYSKNNSAVSDSSNNN